MADLRERAVELHQLGLTKHRAFRVLRREFPNAERDVLVRAAELPGAPLGKQMPIWVQVCGYGMLRQVICKRPPKGIA